MDRGAHESHQLQHVGAAPLWDGRQFDLVLWFISGVAVGAAVMWLVS